MVGRMNTLPPQVTGTVVRVEGDRATVRLDDGTERTVPNEGRDVGARVKLQDFPDGSPPRVLDA